MHQRRTSLHQASLLAATVVLALAGGHAPYSAGPERAGAVQAPGSQISTTPGASGPNTVLPPAPAQPVLTGAVVDAATGRPVAGARIEVLEQLDPERNRERRMRGEFVPEPVAQAVADAEGRFRLTVPAAMRLLVVVEAAGHARSLAAPPMAVTHDRDLGRVELPMGRKVAGKVVDPAGKPVANATVVAFVDREGRPRGGAGASFLRSMVGNISLPAPVVGRTGPDGAFALASLPQRPVSLRAFADGFAPALKEDLRASSGVTITVGAGKPLEGRVVAPDGKTFVAAAWVIAGDEGWDGVTKSGPDGRFTLGNLRPGATSLVAMMPGLSSISSGVGGARAAATMGTTGGTSTTDGTGTARGQDAASRSEPAPRTSTSSAEPTVEFSVTEGTIRDRGTVALTPAAEPASATAPSPSVQASGSPSSSPSGASAAWAPSAPLTVTVPLAAKAAPPALRLRPGGVVRARVIDAESREPITGALLSLDAPGESRRRPAATDAKGDAIFTGVPVGTVDLSAEAEGYLDEDLAAVNLGAGQTREMSAALRAAAAIEGTVRDATGRPVVGAEVSIAGPPPVPIPLPVPIFFPIGIDPVTSDAQGRFVLEQLPSKVELKLSVASVAYAPWDEAGIKLRPGERRRGMEILLDAGLRITGRLVDAEGKPVTAAAITASRSPEGPSGGMVFRFGGPGGGRGGPGGGRGGMRGGLMGGEDLPEIYPDADGAFLVRGAKPGVWSLDIESPGFAPKSVGGLKLEEPGPLDAGEIVLEPGVLLKGIVQTAAGEPVAYARCRVMKEFSVLSEFLSGEDGAFVSGSLAPGSNVTLVIDADGFAAVEKPGLTPPVEDLVVTLKPASRVLGRVVEKDSGRPVQDFGIAASRSRSAGGGGMRMNMEVMGGETPFHSEDGTFVLEDVDPGKVSISARAPGYRDAVLRDQEVPEGRDLNGLVFALERSASVSGTVTDDRGRPLPGVSVEKKETSGGMGMMVRAGGRGRTTTDGDGRFVLEGLDRGAMTLAFHHADFESTDLDVDTTKDVEGLRVTLSRGATLFGIVMHEEDGTPVARASVTATAAGGDRLFGSRSVTTGADGAFSIEGVAAGRYTVRAEAAGFRSAIVENVLVEAGPPAAPIELRLAGGVTLTGTITGVKESELPRFTVRVVGGGGGGGGLGRTAPVDATGRFEIKGMSPGAATLMAGSGLFGGRTMAKTVTIPEGAASFETVIEFPRGNVVEGTVTRGGGPVAGASVIFMHAVARTSTTATTDAAGHYAAEDLDDGEYNVTVMQFSSGLSHSTKASVEADRTLDIALPLATLSGYVTDATSRRAIDGAAITIKKTDGAPALGGSRFIFQQQWRTDATGLFRIEGLEDGAYALNVQKEGYGTVSRTVSIVPNLDSAEASIEMEPAEGFSFRAVDSASGLPLRALSALVVSGGGDPLAPGGSGAVVAFQGSVSPDASGVFHVRTLRPGKYRVVLGGEGVATETLHDVTVPASDLTITMVPGGTIEVTAGGLRSGETATAVLLDRQGRPVHLATFPPEPAFILRDDAPRTLADVKPGAYVLRVALPGGGIAEKPVAVSAGATTRVAIP